MSNSANNILFNRTKLRPSKNYKVLIVENYGFINNKIGYYLILNSFLKLNSFISKHSLNFMLFYYFYQDWENKTKDIRNLITNHVRQIWLNTYENILLKRKLWTWVPVLRPSVKTVLSPHFPVISGKICNINLQKYSCIIFYNFRVW